MLIWYVIGLLLFLILTCEYYAFKTGVPTVTSIPSARKKMIEILRAEYAARGGEGGTPFTIMDLGSGTGKLALEIGRAIPQAQVIGIEISFVPFLFSQLRKALWRVPNVQFRRTDFWATSIADVDAIAIYMNSVIRQRMSAKLKAELRRGALVISNETHLTEGWAPAETYEVGILKLKIVTYRKG